MADQTASVSSVSVERNLGLLAPALDRLHNGVLLCRGETIVFANQACIKMLGCQSADDVTGKPFVAFFHADYKDLGELGLGVLAEDEEEKIPLKLVGADGRAIESDLWVSRLDEGNPDTFWIEMHETSHHLKAARALRAREQFLQVLIDSLPDGVRLIDQNYRIVKANRTYCDQLGQTMREVINSPCYRSSHGREEPCAPTLVTCPLHEIQEDAKPVKCTHRHIRADGTPVFVEVSATPLTIDWEGESTLMVVEAIRDLTQQENLSHEQKLSGLGQFATGVAHEIHNPLTSARLTLQSSLRDIREGDFDIEEIAHYLGLLDGEIDKCIDVTRRLLNLAAPPGKSLGVVSITEGLSDVTSLLAYEANRLRVDVKTHLPDEDIRVMATGSEMRMVILNLVQNAFHAMPEGGTLDITLRTEGDMVTLDFEDTGAGIAPDVLPRIFDPFFSRRVTSEAGTGLGLAICKSLLAHYNGRIDVESELGRGTRFTITLPSAESIGGIT